VRQIGQRTGLRRLLERGPHGIARITIAGKSFASVNPPYVISGTMTGSRHAGGTDLVRHRRVNRGISSRFDR